MFTQVRVNRLCEADSFVIHVKHSVVILEEVDAEIGLAGVTCRRYLQDAVAIPVYQILMLRNHVLRRVDCKSQVWHGVVLLNCASGAPKANRVQLGFASAILVMHDAE